MSTKINVRSPYYVTNDTGTIDIRIWEGDESTATDVDYTLTKDLVGGYATFEIAELIRDYINASFNGTYTSYAVWVKVNAGTPVIAFDGYTSYADGVNAQGNLKQLISNTTLWIPQGADVVVPVFAQGTSYNVVFKDASDATINTVAVTDQTNTNAIIKYAASTIGANDVATIEIGATTLQVRQMECSKYDAYNIVFVNKHGALQDLYFFKKAIKSLNTTKETYKANNLSLGSTVTYDTTAHQYQNIDLQGREAIVLSTGFVSEDYNDPIKEMMLSEKVWMVNPDGDIIPVNVNTSEVTFRTSLNDKMVEYQVEFEYAYDAINNVR